MGRWIFWIGLTVVACGGTSAGDDAGTSDSSTIDVGSDVVADAMAFDTGTVDSGADASVLALGTVTNVADAACPANGPPSGSQCKTLTITGCPGLESDAIQATIAILDPTGTAKGIVTHFSGSGGEGFEKTGASEYQAAGLRQVFVGWGADWENTSSAGIKAAACRPATVLRWIFDEPSLQAGSRSQAFCAQGFSGGAGQLGYALAQYGLGDYLDYVNELSGPPFARLDLGCDGNAAKTAQVCGATDTMQLPAGVAMWENIPAPYTCGGTNAPQSEIDRWRNDSIAIGGTYDYPKTEVQFYACTYQSTAVTAMGQIYEQLIVQAEGSSGKVGYHCYTQADGCMQEALGNGAADAVTALVAGCGPHH